MITKDQYISEPFIPDIPKNNGYIKHSKTDLKGYDCTWYYLDKKLHRLDGPAIEVDSSWWINGVEMTQDEFLVLVKNFDSKDISTAVDILSV